MKNSQNNSMGENPLAIEPIGKLLRYYAVPSIIAMVVNALYNIADQFFIGHSSDGYLGNAATNIAFPITVIGLALALLLGQGCATFISLKLGENDIKDANRAFGSMITVLSVISIAFSIACAIWLRPILYVLGATDAIMAYCVDYTSVLLIGQPFVILTIAMGNVTRADGSPRYSMIRMLTGAGINVVLDPIFIFVFGMGVKGAAIATVISQIIVFFMSVYYFLGMSRYVHFSLPDLKPHFSLIGRIMALGASGFATQTAVGLVNIFMNNQLRHYGAISPFGSEIPLSAMGIVLKVASIMIGVLVGLSAGAQPILGFNYGAKNYLRVRDTYIYTVKIATVFSTSCWLCFMLFPRQLILLFGDNTPEFVAFGVLCFRRYLGLMLVAGFQITSANYFQAVGFPVRSIFLSMSRQVILLIPSMLILGSLLGLDGVLYSGMVADAGACVVSGLVILAEMRRLNLCIEGRPSIGPA